jgi:hypothetical protein
MHMQFSRIISFVDLQIWNATNNGFSFVISFSSRSGPGFRGRLGFVASWRPIYQNRTAIKVGGSPFKTLAEAEKACTTMLVTAKAANARPTTTNPDHTAATTRRRQPRNAVLFNP